VKGLICELGGESRAEVLSVGHASFLRGHSLTSEWAAENFTAGIRYFKCKTDPRFPPLHPRSKDDKAVVLFFPHFRSG
jgi:hypothetical protein